MMQAQLTGMIQINHKKDHFDEINKKLNVEKYEGPSIALTAIALIWKWWKISFSQLVFICTSISRSACTRKTPFRFKEILVKRTQKSKWKETAQFIEKRVDDIIRSSLWSFQLRETSRNIAAKTKMTYSLLEVY